MSWNEVLRASARFNLSYGNLAERHARWIRDVSSAYSIVDVSTPSGGPVLHRGCMPFYQSYILIGQHVAPPEVLAGGVLCSLELGLPCPG